MDIFSAFKVILVVVGGATVVLALYQLSSFITFHFLPFGNSLKNYQRQPRAWALVTGASAGIGFGHARELAARGFGVIILGHKEGEVNDAVAEIKAEIEDAAVEKIILDATEASYSDIEAALAPFIHLPITILVNNVSVQISDPIFTNFASYTSNNIYYSIAANNIFPLYITRALYPVLKRNGPSLIINLSSGGGVPGLPWLSVYCGTKAFTESWSKSISRETKALGDHIDSIAILPGDVRTQGNRYGCYPTSPTGREYAKMILDRVGRAVSWDVKAFTPYWKHAIEIALVRTLPDSMTAEALVANVRERKMAEEKAR